MNRATSFSLPIYNETHCQLFALGRNAMYAAGRLLGLRPGDEVLTPAFDCDGSLQPFTALGCSIRFFRSDAMTFAADVEDLKARVTPKTRLLHVINHFGMPQPWDKLLALRDKTGIPILEDNAYSLFSTWQGRPFGTFGDLAVFSLRKNLPLLDGGLLRVNHPAYQAKELPCTHSRWFYPTEAAGLLNLAKSLLGYDRAPEAVRRLVRVWGTPPGPPPPLYSDAAERHPVWPLRDHIGKEFAVDYLRPMSRLARHQLAGWSSAAYADVAKKKRESYQWLVDHISKADLPSVSVLWPELPEGIVPFCLSMLITSKRDEYLERLRRRYDVMAWPTLPQAVLDRLEEFPEVQVLGRQLLQLNLSAQAVRRSDFPELLERFVRDLRRIADGCASRTVVPVSRRQRADPGNLRRQSPETECRWVEDIDEFRRLVVEWDTAVLSSRPNNPFTLSDFITMWWKYRATGRRLRICVISQAGRIVAGLPLCLEQRGMRRYLVHVGGPAANLTQGFAVHPGIDLMSQLAASLESRNDWDDVLLERVLLSHPLLRQAEVRRGAARNGHLVCEISDAGMNGVIDLRGGYEAVVKHLPERLRRYIRRAQREVVQMGGLGLHRVQGTPQVRDLFREFRKLSIESFSRRDRISAFQDEIWARFFEELLATFEAKGWLDAHRLTADASTLAISFGYRFGEGFQWILTTFNPEFAHLRPGHLLIDALVKEAIQRGDPWFDMFSGGELFYKQQWCTEQIPLRQLLVYRDTVLNRSFHASEAFVRSRPLLLRAARAVLPDAPVVGEDPAGFLQRTHRRTQ